MTAPRYVAEPRPGWEPPQFVVLDSHIGSIVSKHEAEKIAKATAMAMNHRRKLV